MVSARGVTGDTSLHRGNILRHRRLSARRAPALAVVAPGIAEARGAELVIVEAAERDQRAPIVAEGQLLQAAWTCTREGITQVLPPRLSCRRRRRHPCRLREHLVVCRVSMIHQQIAIRNRQLPLLMHLHVQSLKCHQLIRHLLSLRGRLLPRRALRRTPRCQLLLLLTCYLHRLLSLAPQLLLARHPSCSALNQPLWAHMTA